MSCKTLFDTPKSVFSLEGLSKPQKALKITLLVTAAAAVAFSCVMIAALSASAAAPLAGITGLCCYHAAAKSALYLLSLAAVGLCLWAAYLVNDKAALVNDKAAETRPKENSSKAYNLNNKAKAGVINQPQKRGEELNRLGAKVDGMESAAGDFADSCKTLAEKQLEKPFWSFI